MDFFISGFTSAVYIIPIDMTGYFDIVVTLTPLADFFPCFMLCFYAYRFAVQHCAAIQKQFCSEQLPVQMDKPAKRMQNDFLEVSEQASSRSSAKPPIFGMVFHRLMR